MKIAIITGASSGLGEQFALKTDLARPEIEEIWLIARREERLTALAQKLNKKVRVLTKNYQHLIFKYRYDNICT